MIFVAFVVYQRCGCRTIWQTWRIIPGAINRRNDNIYRRIVVDTAVSALAIIKDHNLVGIRQAGFYQCALC